MRGSAKLRHKLLLCRQEDVIEGNEMKVHREGVLSMWGAIEVSRGSTFSTTGAAMKDSRNTRTHKISVRYRSDINISAMAWLYEERLKSSPRWFKILSVSETEGKGTRYFTFDCRITERGDEVSKPVTSDAAKGPVRPPPSGVKL